MIKPINYFLLTLVVFIYFLFPMAKAVGAFGSLFLLIVGVFFFLKDLRGNLIPRGVVIASFPFIALFLLSLFGALYGMAATQEKIDYIIKSLRYLVIFFGAHFLFRLNFFGVALQSFSVSMAVTLAMVYMSVVFVLPWAPHVPQTWGGDHTIWGDYITQNIMMSFFAIWMLHQAFEGRRKEIKALYFILFALASIAVLALSYGRTGYVMLITAFLGYCFLSLKYWRWRILVCLMVVASVFVLYFWVDAFHSRVNQAYIEFLTTDKKNLTSIGARLLMWETALEIGWNNFWWGVGSGSYAAEWCGIVEELSWCGVGQHPHNHFLLLFASNGIFAFLLYSFLILSGVFLIFKKHTKSHLLLFVYLSILLVDSLLNGPFWNIREANFFTLIGAIVLAMIFREITQHPTKDIE